jgi:hypothetical protein
VQRRSIALLVPLLLTVSSAGCGEPDPAPAGPPTSATTTAAVSTTRGVPSRPSLLGRWQVVHEKPLPPNLELFWTFDETHVTVTDRAGEEMSRNPYSVDEAARPPKLVMRVAGEKDRVGWFRTSVAAAPTTAASPGEEVELALSVNTGLPPRSWDDGRVVLRRVAPP